MMSTIGDVRTLNPLVAAINDLILCERAGADGGLLAEDIAKIGTILKDGSVVLTSDWDAGSFKITAEQFESDIATGTAPFVVASETEVANLKSAKATLADAVTTIGNLTGVVTSTNRATAIADKTLAIAKLADGIDGELITWSAAGEIETVSVGTAGHVLTSGGVGVAPTYQVPGAAGNLTGHITSTGLATILGSFTIAQLNTAVSDATLVDFERRDIAFSDEDTDLTTGEAKVTFHMPNYATILLEVSIGVTTAPTGSTAIFDLEEAGTTVLSTLITIDAGEKTSEDAATPPVISDSNLAANALMSVDIDQIGSSVAGAGAKLYLKYRRA